MIFSDALLRLPPRSVPGFTAPDQTEVKLNQNESPWPLTADESAALAEALRTVPLNRYPDPAHTAVEQAIADGTGLAPQKVLAGNGANELIALLIRAACNVGDEVLTAAPTYHLYDWLCAMSGARLVKVPWGPGFSFPRSALRRALSPRTKLILLCRPNNPTGHLYPHAEVLALADAFDGIVAVDEAYYDFAQDTMAASIRTRSTLAVVRTLSKAYGAAGIRFGYLLGPEPIVDAVRALELPYGMSGLNQEAARFLLGRRDIMERQRAAIVAGRIDLARRLAGIPGLTVFPSSANFLLVQTAGSADAVDRHLRSRRVLVRNLHWADRYLRISVGTPEEHGRLEAALQSFAAGEWLG